MAMLPSPPLVSPPSQSPVDGRSRDREVASGEREVTSLSRDREVASLSREGTGLTSRGGSNLSPREITSLSASQIGQEDDFSRAMAAQFKAAQAILTVEHKKDVGSLQAEIERLRKELFRCQLLHFGNGVSMSENSKGEATNADEVFDLCDLDADVVNERRVHTWARSAGADNGACQSHGRGLGLLSTRGALKPEGIEELQSEQRAKDTIGGLMEENHNHQDITTPTVLEDGDNQDEEDAEDDEGARRIATAEHFKELTAHKMMQDQTAGFNSDGQPEMRLTRRTSTYGDHFPVEKDKWTLLQRIVFSNHFELMSGAVIMANTIIMSVQQQYDGFDLGFLLKQPGSRPANDVWPGANRAFMICNLLFNSVFGIELLLRIGANHWRSVKSGWIWFDAVVVSAGFVDSFATDTLSFNPGMMRAVRLFRLLRLLKVFQAMSEFDSLFLLLKAVHASKQALVWSFLILGLCQFVVGLFLCQILQDFLNDEDIDMQKRQEVFVFFGTFSRTTLTMFEITMANWTPSCRTLTENVSEVFAIFYLVYRCMFIFAILKVIAAVFITETNRVLESDDELSILKHDRGEYMFRRKLIKVFTSVDTAHTGKFGWQQLAQVMSDDTVKNLVTTLGFERHDFEKLFWLMDTGCGEISIQEFVNKLAKLRGSSKTIDTAALLKVAHDLDNKIELLLKKEGFITKTDLELAEEELACRL